MPEQITILGNGAMATVCATLLAAGGHGVTMWGAFPESIDRLKRDRGQDRLLPGARVPDAVRLTADDAEALAGATMILSAIPTQHMRSVWERLKPHVPAGAPAVTVAKGVENGTLQRPTQVIADVLGGWDRNPPVALSGPNIAAEIAQRLPATAVAAAADLAVAERVQAAFATPWFRVYTNADVVGVELAGATKNVIAIAAGVLEGLSAGNNAKASLVTRGIVEITRLGVAMGAKASTFAGLAGLGDLITTCFSPQSRNRTVGERVGRGETLDQILATMASVAEGVPTTRSVVQLARRHGVEMPITEAVHAILFDGKAAGTALTDLMTRGPKPEWNE